MESLTTRQREEAGSARRALAVLGPKGVKTRRRLLDAAAALLETMSPVSLTAVAVARKAGVSPASFYVYFDDIGDIVHELALDANNDLDALMAVLQGWRAGTLTAQEGARAFIAAFREHWNRHRTILNVRNLEADRGEARFLVMRQEAGMRLIRELAHLLPDRSPSDTGGPGKEAVARATVVYAAIERLAATELLYPPPDPDMPSREDVAEAEIGILMDLMAPR